MKQIFRKNFTKQEKLIYGVTLGGAAVCILLAIVMTLSANTQYHLIGRASLIVAFVLLIVGNGYTLFFRKEEKSGK